MPDQITKTWKLALGCGHTVTVIPHPGGAKVAGMEPGCQTCEGILEPEPNDDGDG